MEAQQPSCGTAGASTIVFPFLLDRYEVTVGRFRKFVAAVEGGFSPAKGAGKDPNDPQDRGWDFVLPESIRPRVDASAPTSTWTDSPGPHESRPVNLVLSGSVWEWARDPTPSGDADLAQACGGGFFDVAMMVKATCLSGPPRIGQGFRCARALPEAP